MCMRYSGISDCDIANGKGMRVTLYTQGCSHRCFQCHNPETWDGNGGTEFTKKTLDKICKLLDRPYIDGLTLSGGDPLFSANREDVLSLCKEVKKKFPQKNIWLYTGYLFEEIENLEIMNYVDVVVDGKFNFMLRDTSLAFRGSSNQRIIDVKESKNQHKIVLIDVDK